MGRWLGRPVYPKPMMRAALEALVTLIVIAMARAIISSLLKSFSAPGVNTSGSGQSTNSSSQTFNGPQAAQTKGVLHRDPVCGTFVAESTPFRRQVAGSIFYYCSENCRGSHATVGR
jgi:YHS domain-containing protein